MMMKKVCPNFEWVVVLYTSFVMIKKQPYDELPVSFGSVNVTLQISMVPRDINNKQMSVWH